MFDYFFSNVITLQNIGTLFLFRTDKFYMGTLHEKSNESNMIAIDLTKREFNK